MSPLFRIDPKSCFLLTWKLSKKAIFTPDPNINTGSEIIIPDADSASHQTVPKIEKFVILPLASVFNYVLERV